MQSKGAIKFFAILFTLVCIYQLSFTFFTKRIESKAKEYATNDEAHKIAKQLAKGNAVKESIIFDSISRVRETIYLDSMSDKGVYNLGIRNYTYKECKSRELNLGLDLKGGMNVTMEVSVPDIIISLSGNSKDIKFRQAIQKANEMQKTSQRDYVDLFYDAFKSIDPNARLASIFSYSIKDKITSKSTNDEVIKIIKDETTGAIDRTFNVLRTRIDRFGVTQPNIQKLQTTGRILVELPGIKEPERVRKLLQGTAKLEFWETYEFKEVYQYFDDANKKLKAIINGEDTTKAKNDTLAEKTEEKADTAKSLVDKVKNEKAKGNTKDTKNQSAEKWKAENPLFALMRPAFVEENGKMFPNRGPRVGFAEIKDTAKLNKYLSIPQVKAIFPRDLKLLWTKKSEEQKEAVLELIAIKSTRDEVAPLGGDVIVDARQDFGQNNSNEISMTMNSDGAKKWKRLTAQNAKDKKSIAIVLDNYVYSYPFVQGEIPNGHSSITGGFSLEEAKDLANVLKAGKLPAPAKIVEEAVVGPSLGKEAIDAGLMSFVLAFIGVLLYMSLYYNRAGHVADIALFANVFFLFGVLASLQAVLTLPGIAGIVLTLAMAVDSNVIIYERMREEILLGKSDRLVVKDGFKHALSAIIDGHVTTILTGVVLYIFGSGPVQGFATTLIVGLLLSLFSSIFIARLIFEWMLTKNMKITVDNNKTRNAFKNTKINFIGQRKKWYIISGTFIAIGIVTLFIRGLSPGIDFTGGRTYIVRFDKDVHTDNIRKALSAEYGEAPEVKSFGPSNQVKITTKYLIDQENRETDSIVEMKLYNGLKTFLPTGTKAEDFRAHKEGKLLGMLSSQKIGPTIAKDMIFSAFYAVFFGLLIIFIYISFRFRNWKYGLGGIISLAHDVMVIITMFTLFHGILPFNMEVDQSFIAAILTVIGYSIMDTVIIYDRIREYTRDHPKMPLDENINGAINSTLGRTINTSGITIVVLVIIFIFGGEILRGFVFALLVGVSIGTYSSIFNATPVSYDLIKYFERRNSKKQIKKL